MFIERLLNQGTGPIVEQAVKFSAARHQVLAENVANVSTPGYVQKDMDVAGFQRALRERIEERKSAAPGTVRFNDVRGEVEEVEGNLLFHDGGNRSMEQLMSDAGKNALFHNMMVELLRKQFGAIEAALREKVG